jgi:manganese/zinc/iron transport system substrate-binding protein
MKWALAVGLVLGVLAGCGGSGDSGESGESRGGGAAGEGGRIMVVATTTMIADLAQVIAGDDAQVAGIMKPGEDPHTYDIRPRDAQTLADADVILANGLHLEATLAHIIENHAQGKVVAYLAEHPDIVPRNLQSKGGAPDPHCWFNVKYFMVYAQGVCDALVKADPAHAPAYRQRAQAYLAQLAQLDDWVRTQLETIPRSQRVLVTSHDAFAYFGAAYGVEVLSIIGISTEQQPRPQDMENLERQVREHHIRALFVETSVTATLNEMVRKVAAATGAAIGGTLFSDSLGPPDTEAGTYLGMVRHNVSTMVKALKGAAGE